MLPLLHGILITFRIEKISNVADFQTNISENWNMRNENENNRDFLRYISFDNNLSNNPSYVLWRFARVVFVLRYYANF